MKRLRAAARFPAEQIDRAAAPRARRQGARPGQRKDRDQRRSHSRAHRRVRQWRRARRLQHARSRACSAPNPTPMGAASITRERLDDVLQRKFLLYDKAGEEHFNLISALHKSVRNSDPDAALYWLARMLESGEDPLYIARRMVRMASEDIGLADPGALAVTIAAMQAVDFVGPPGRQSGAGASRRLSFARAQIQRALHRIWRRDRTICRAPSREPVPLHLAQCRHRTDGTPRLRQRLSIRAQRRGKSHRHGLPARKVSPAAPTTSHRSGLRSAHTPAPRRNPPNPEEDAAKQ